MSKECPGSKVLNGRSELTLTLFSFKFCQMLSLLLLINRKHLSTKPLLCQSYLKMLWADDRLVSDLRLQLYAAKQTRPNKPYQSLFICPLMSKPLLIDWDMKDWTPSWGTVLVAAGNAMWEDFSVMPAGNISLLTCLLHFWVKTFLFFII